MNYTDNPRSASLKTHVTPAEKIVIERRARSVKMTNSDYMRQVLVEFQIPQSIIEYERIQEIMVVVSNLAKLGNLFKLGINNAETNENLDRFDSEMRRILAEIQDTKNLIWHLLQDLKRQVNRHS